MISYDNLAKDINIMFDDQADLPLRFKGMYIETSDKQMILVSKYIRSATEKKCVLAEEIGHFHKTVGNIVDQQIIDNKKQEETARRWAYEKLVPLEGIISASKAGVKNRFELADHLDIIEDFLDEAIEFYRRKYGLLLNFDEKYVIYFDPLGVIEYF
ncbi:ImmA/IrrE family metallo-endopeptidase [Paenibacillus sp. KQZ6P-2]|uniref:ImmA/IrrE family metallo-endopeptidase n=1 Tax=Paenibacillus mangrovi TaxID=2931978 RepID=A0A9X2B518_9BACL|nr:ImmA/IrrE family metallo-endopeptidase [Paenibacillus mangrovi]MCJ8015254.1 ImmA/IrrE family metallo-endopeptidase [Paenibacillus mangrovi]